jgi:hypothetical protein
MKYIITESRLNDIIESYLNSELGNLKLVERREDTDWYVNKSGRPIVIISKRSFGKDILSLRRDIYDNLEKIFGLETTDDIQAHLRKYFYTKWELPVDIVYTYGLGNENMLD